MPLDEELQQKLQQQMNKEIRVTYNHRAKDMRTANEELFNLNSIKNDILDINKLLFHEDKDALTEEQRAKLEMIRGRNLSSLLVMSEKTTGDSKEMKKVKKAVAAVERKLNEEKQNPFNAADIDAILRIYDTAIEACRDYMYDKNPKYKKGQKRYQIVETNAIRLHTEAEAFLVAKELIHSGVLNGNCYNARQLLVQAKVYGLTEGGNPQGEEQERELPSEQTVKDSGYESELLYRAFSGKERPSDLINRLSKSKNKKDKAFGHELIQFFFNIRNSLNDFREGKVQAKVFMIGDTVLSVTQNVFGQLTLNVKNIDLPLDQHTGIIADMLSSDIVKNEKTYGRAYVDSVIRNVINEIDITKATPEKRQIIMDYLTGHTKYKTSDFSTFFTEDLVFMTRCLLKGKTIRILSSKRKLNRNPGDNVVVFAKEHSTLINESETRELLKKTQKQENRQSVQEKVTFQKNEQNAVNIAAPAQENVQEEPKWDEKEQKIIDFVSDILFSDETWTADSLVREPGARMKLMLQKHTEALAYLIGDMFSTTNHLKLINSILDKMPLFMMNPEDSAKLRNAVTTGVEKVTTSIKDEIDKRIVASIGKCPEGFLESIGYNTKKGFITLAAYTHLSTPELLKNGVEIKDKDGNVALKIDSLSTILRDLDPDAIKLLADAENKIDEGVNDASKDIQKTVSSYSKDLFKPDDNNQIDIGPDPNQPGLHLLQVKNRKINRIKKGHEKLNKMVKDSMTAGTEGQGLFTKLVFENYFKGVDVMDKRAMLSSMFRNSRPVGTLLNENEENIGDAEKERRQTYNEKLKTACKGNYIGGLLKGAGPLFQKMMQGLPTEGLPDELKSAVKDMKSKLSPIPDKVVEAQLYSIVQRSHKQIKKIKVIKPLGAASVGQTFLCKITRSDGKEEEVAIKLLKPDVNNRMMREKKLMIDCARKTDIQVRRKENQRRLQNHQQTLPEIGVNEKGGMQVTYEGQLKRIEEELDLTIEARNVERGKIYDNAKTDFEKKVVSMKLNNLVAPTTNSMVLEKAPGETVEDLIERIKKETQEIKDVYKRRILPNMTQEQKDQVQAEIDKNNLYYSSPTELAEAMGVNQNSAEFSKLDYLYHAEKVAKLLKELKLKKSYLLGFAKKWVTEGLFEKGFYHGDPHAGNIMISDEKLTVIDFGNCTQITEDQQLHVTRMVTAASIGDMETFRSGLHSLLDPKFESLYQAKREKLGEEITKIFALGDKKSTGARIAVALMKAQELGLEIPSAVYNFSQGQIRIQNAIDDMNRQIEETEKVAKFFIADTFGENKTFDFTDTRALDQMDVDEFGDNALKYVESFKNSYFTTLILNTNNVEDIKEFAIEYFDDLKTTVMASVKQNSGQGETVLQKFRQLVETRKNATPEMLKNNTWYHDINQMFFDEKLYIDEDFVEDIVTEFRKPEISEEWVEEMIEKITNRINTVENSVRLFDQVDALHGRILAAHKNKWEPNEAEKAEYEQLCGQFAEAYTPLHIAISQASESGNIHTYFNNLTLDYKRKQTLNKEIEQFFFVHPEGKEEFYTAYNDLILADRMNLKVTDPESYIHKKRHLRNIYHNIMVKRLREKRDIYSYAGDKSTSDFLSVMAKVVDEQLPKVTDRLGKIKGYFAQKKMEQQDAERAALGLKDD